MYNKNEGHNTDEVKINLCPGYMGILLVILIILIILLDTIICRSILLSDTGYVFLKIFCTIVFSLLLLALVFYSNHKRKNDYIKINRQYFIVHYHTGFLYKLVDFKAEWDEIEDIDIHDGSKMNWLSLVYNGKRYTIDINEHSIPKVARLIKQCSKSQKTKDNMEEVETSFKWKYIIYLVVFLGITIYYICTSL